MHRSPSTPALAPAPRRRRRTPSRRALALLALIAVLGPLSILAPSAGAVGHEITGGTVTWGFKESFRNYVPVAGQSAIEGATLVGGAFEFPASGGRYDPATRELTVESTGAAVFSYQAHMFLITLRAPRLVITPDRSVLDVELTVEIVDQVTGEVQTTSTSRSELAELDISQGTRQVTDGGYSWSGIPARLTPAGAEAFTARFPDGSTTQFYNAGDALDPVSLAVTGDWPAELVEQWDAPGDTRLVMTGNVPTSGLIRGMGADHDRDVVFAAQAEKLLHVLDGETGQPLQEPIALPVAPLTSYPVLVDQDSGDVKVIGFGTEAEYGIDHPGSPSFNSVITIPRTAQGYGPPTWSAFHPRLNTNGNAVLDQDTGDVYVSTSEQATLPDGSLASAMGGRVLRIPDSAASGLITAPVAYDDVTGVADPQTAGQRTLGLDQATGRLYLATSASGASASWNAVKVLDVADGFSLVSDTPVAETIRARSLAVDQATGRLYLMDTGAGFHEYEGRTGTGPLTRTATAPRVGTMSPHVPPGQRLVWTNDSTNPSASVALFGTSPQLGQRGRTLALASTARPGMITTGADGRAFVGILGTTGAGVRGVRIVEQMATPAVTDQPDSVSVGSGGTATFTVAGTGRPAPTVRWQQGSALGWIDLADEDGITGSGTGTLRVPVEAGLDGTHFRAVLTNEATDWTGASVPVGAVASEPATLTVAAPSTGGQIITVVVPEDTGPGELVWSIPGSGAPVVMSEAVDAGDHWRMTGSINPVAVSDTRVGGPGWSLSGQVSDFSGGLSGRYLGWTPRVLAAGAGAVEGAPVPSGFASGDGLSTASTLASAAAGHPVGSATVGADLDLKVPRATAPGTYTATLTVTALS